MQAQKLTFWIATSLSLLAMTSGMAGAAINIPFTINLSENVTVTGTPRIAVDVGGNTRYATYTSGTGTNALTFTLSPTIGDIDLDGVTVSSPIDLNGGTIKDTAGNDATLTFTPPNTSGIKVNYPSLGMDFTNGTSGRYTLNGTVYNDISSFLTASGGSFARNSIGTYFDSTGTLQTASANTPRFDYDPVTHAAKGILIEEQRTNNLSRSSEIDSSPWIKAGTTISANVTMAPNGSNEADKIVANSANTVHSAIYTLSLATPYTATYSIYLKAAEYRYAAIGFSNNITYSVKTHVDLQTGSILSTDAANPDWTSVSSQILNVGNGWYKVSLTATKNTSVGGSGTIEVIPENLASNLTFTGDGTSGIYLWGAQLEQGAFATSYIPTTTAAVKRNAENFYIPTGSWTDLSQGTIASTSDHFGINTVDGIFALNDGTVSNRIDCRAGQHQCIVTSSSMDTFQGTLFFPRNTTNKAAITYSSTLSVSAATANGSAALTGTGSVPSGMTRLWIGNIDQGVYWLNGHISTLKYFPLATTTTQLQLLTQ